MPTRFHHVAIPIPPGSEDLARAFYRDLLGLEEIEKPEPLKPRGGLWLQTPDGVQVHLQIGDLNDGRTRQHFALVVEDGPALQRRIQAEGYETEDDADFTGYTRFYVHDPWGNMIEVLTPLE